VYVYVCLLSCTSVLWQPCSLADVYINMLIGVAICILDGVCMAGPNSAHPQGAHAIAKIYVIYIYKAKKLSVLSITLITCLRLPILTHQVPNTKHSLSAYSKFVTTSSHALPFALQSELNTKV